MGTAGRGLVRRMASVAVRVWPFTRIALDTGAYAGAFTFALLIVGLAISPAAATPVTAAEWHQAAGAACTTWISFWLTFAAVRAMSK